MENKINVSELLKDCPKGMELDCTMFENVTFIRVDISRKFPIEIAVGGIRSKYLTKEGCFHDTTLLPESKCVIFPKGKTTWEGFQRPFKDGEIIATDLGSVFILKSCSEDKIHYHSYVGVTCCNEIQDQQIPFAYKHVCHLATEEEKAKLFQAIKDNGYKWNSETKTLEKLLKFKVGDRIRHKCPEFRGERIIANCDDTGYFTTINDWIDITHQDDWELVPNKFDITTLKPFESRVLVRDFNSDRWKVSFWGCLTDDTDSFKYDTTRGYYKQCIPYEGNQHLLGKADDCDEFYKTWK